MLVWIVVLAVILVLMGGGVLGLSRVPDDQWGGLPITLILATFGLACAFPLAVATALGRRSRALPAVRWLCVAYVELIRGVPLISPVVHGERRCSAVPARPAWRGQASCARKSPSSCSPAPIWPRWCAPACRRCRAGQYEARDALGLSWWQKTRLVVLPQALRHVIPALVNTFIGFFKDTSLVLIISIFDLMTTGRTAIQEPAWQGFGNEIYLLLAVIYFAFCYAMSRYSRDLERARTSR